MGSVIVSGLPPGASVTGTLRLWVIPPLVYEIATSTLTEPSPAGVIVAPAWMGKVQPCGSAGVMIGAVSPLTLTLAVTVRSDTPDKVVQLPLMQVWDEPTVPGMVTLTGPTAACETARDVLEKLYARIRQGEDIGPGDVDGLLRHAGDDAAPVDGLAQIRPGQSQTLVTTVLGSPQFTNDFGGESAYYYVSTHVNETAFGLTTIKDRTVLAIYFDKNRQVQRLANYGLQDGKIFDFISRTTPTSGQELSYLQPLFKLLSFR